MKIKVAVIFGGRSVEHEVSIISALQAMNSIDAEKYDIVPVYITKSGGEFFCGEVLRDIANYKDMVALIKKARRVNFVSDSGRTYIVDYPAHAIRKKPVCEVDVAFPIVHGTNAEDGTLAGYLRLLGVPFVGCGVLASALGMDKYAAKILLREEGIPVLDCLKFTRRDYTAAEQMIEKIEGKFPYPVIVKPINLGSSVGISKAADKESLSAALELAFTFSDKVIVEPAIVSLREINCAVLGDADEAIASECEEPLNAGDILSYEDKYIDGSKGSKFSGMASVKRKIPADLPQELREKIRGIALDAFRVLDCAGVARIDFLLDTAEDKIYLNEINTIPGSLSFYLFEPIGIKYSELLERMIQTAFRRARADEDVTYSFDTNILSLGGKFGGKK